MADKGTYRQIAGLKKRIYDEEQKVKDWETTLDQLKELLEAETTADGKKEYKSLQKDAEADLLRQSTSLAKLYDELANLESTLPQKDATTAPKFDPEKHPLLKKNTEKVEPVKPVVFTSGSHCEAQWSDRLWYKAVVLTVLGSAADPKYHVKFPEYNETCTVGSNAIRPLVNEKKRKAEASVPTPPAPPAANSPHVISGPASINPDAVAAKQKDGAETEGPTNRRKIGSRKALERKESDWKKFLNKGPGKSIKQKDSMFRSGTGVNSRVGFTGSGAGMSSTIKRVRHNYKEDEEKEARLEAHERGTPQSSRGVDKQHGARRF